MSHTLHLEAPAAPRMSREKVRKLLLSARQGDTSARDTLVEANLRLVFSVVQRFRNRGVDLDDLFQVGAMGLIKAIEKFDLSFDVAFSTYAVPLIIGEIQRYLREDQPVRVGRTVRTLAARANSVRDKLTQRLSRSPTPDEIAEEMGISREEVVLLLDADQRPVSIDQPINMGQDRPMALKDQLAAEDSDLTTERLALIQVLQDLTEEERTVITLRYIEQIPQTKVAELIACSQAHVSRLEKRIIMRMRRMWNS